MSLALGSFLVPAATPAGAVTVSLPAIEAFVGEGLSVPLSVDAVAAGEYFSFAARVRWDPDVVRFVNPWVTFAGGVASSWTWEMNRDTPGEVLVVAFGTSPLAAGGDLFHLYWQAVGSSGESTSLEIAEFRFNELPSPTLVNGSVTIRFPSTVNVALEHVTNVALDSELCVALTTDASPEDVYAFETVISWDPTMLELVDPFFARGNLTNGAAWNLKTDPSTPGSVGIAAWSTSPLAGAGTLGCLQFRMRGAPSSWTVLRFEAFRFNEGFPAAQTTHGRVEAVAGTDCVPIDIPDDIVVSWYESLQVPVNIGNTDGREIYSLQSMVTWDPDLLRAQPGVEAVVLDEAGPAGAWTQGNLVWDASTPGRLRFLAFGDSPLIGLGTVLWLNLRAQDVSGTATAIFEHTFRLNEGSPCTIGMDGLVVVPVERTSWGAIKAAYR